MYVQGTEYTLSVDISILACAAAKAVVQLAES